MDIFKQRRENKVIAIAIDLIENGKFEENGNYRRLLAKGKPVKLNGFVFTKNTYCYVVWKANPDPNSEDVSEFKVVPRFGLSVSQIMKILSAQNWVRV